MTICKAYYAGGARVVVDGVPVRFARKPSAANLADLRQWERSKGKIEYEGANDRAKRIASHARKDIAAYAKNLGISESAAKAKITAHREWIVANPVEDLSLEYDL